MPLGSRIKLFCHGRHRWKHHNVIRGFCLFSVEAEVCGVEKVSNTDPTPDYEGMCHTRQRNMTVWGVRIFGNFVSLMFYGSPFGFTENPSCLHPSHGNKGSFNSVQRTWPSREDSTRDSVTVIVSPRMFLKACQELERELHRSQGQKRGKRQKRS